MTATAEPASASGSDAPSPSRWRKLRRWLTPVFVTAVLAVAGYLIYRALTRYSLDEIAASVTSIPLDHIARMGGFAAASYLCLTCFDALARALCRPVPAVLAGGVDLVRRAVDRPQYRLRRLEQRRDPLPPLLAVGPQRGTRWRSSSSSARSPSASAWCILGGLALLLQPGLAQEITRLDRRVILALGITCMLVASAYLALAAFVRRPLRFRRWSLRGAEPEARARSGRSSGR